MSDKKVKSISASSFRMSKGDYYKAIRFVTYGKIDYEIVMRLDLAKKLKERL